MFFGRYSTKKEKLSRFNDILFAFKPSANETILNDFDQNVYITRGIGTCRFPIVRAFEKFNDQVTPVHSAWLSDYDRLIAPKYAEYLQKVILIRDLLKDEETGLIFCRNAGLTDPDLSGPCQKVDVKLQNDSVTYLQYETW